VPWKMNVSTYSTLLIINIAILCMPKSGPRAQASPQIERLAAQTAKKVAKTDARRILTTPLSGCLRAPQLCTEFDAVLSANLEKLITDAKFIQREVAVKHLPDHGFLAVDAYMGAPDDVASDAGAEVVVGEDFQRKREACNLRTTVTDAKPLYALGDFSTGISCSSSNTTGPGPEPLRNIADSQRDRFGGNPYFRWANFSEKFPDAESCMQLSLFDF
jgi:hypothetical protein